MITTLHDTITEGLMTEHCTFSIYTKDGKWYSVIKYENTIYYYDRDSVTYDLIFFHVGSFNILNIAYVDKQALSQVQLNPFIYMVLDCNSTAIPVYGSVYDIPEKLTGYKRKAEDDGEYDIHKKLKCMESFDDSLAVCETIEKKDSKRGATDDGDRAAKHPRI